MAERGEIGILDPARMKIERLRGAPLRVSAETRIAHPHDLFETGTLAAWQKELVRRRVVQPCKQASRELYVVTPAERETRTYSLRFAGHAIDARVGPRLLARRGWRQSGGIFYRPFPASGLDAWWEFPGVESHRDYLPYYGTLTTDRISFVARGRQRGGDVPLDEVPPRAFSEAMRDADLVVSVAHRVADARGAGAVPISDEVFERRGDLLRALLEDLGVQGVTIAGHFALVRGKLASYRVHLASGAIHIDPGSYLCIVPSGWGGRRAGLFLPFSDPDPEDLKVAEIVSKVLLLLNDDEIKDESILWQIRARGGRV